MTDPRARGVPPPADSGLQPFYAAADFVNANAVTLPVDAVRPIAEIARIVLENPAPWYDAVRRLRDLIVKPLGLPTTTALRAMAERDGRAIGVFGVLAERPDEILLGGRDDHLDVRLSVMLRPAAEGQADLIVTSVVTCGDALGRAYLAVVRMVHRPIARSQLRRAARHLLAMAPADRAR